MQLKQDHLRVEKFGTKYWIFGLTNQLRRNDGPKLIKCNWAK